MTRLKPFHGNFMTESLELDDIPAGVDHRLRMFEQPNRQQVWDVFLDHRQLDDPGATSQEAGGQCLEEGLG
jgi:hypothetical protein